jgi:hypothetical protein
MRELPERFQSLNGIYIKSTLRESFVSASGALGDAAVNSTSHRQMTESLVASGTTKHLPDCLGASLSRHTRLVVKQHLRAFIGFSATLVIAGAGVANLFTGWW